MIWSFQFESDGKLKLSFDSFIYTKFNPLTPGSDEHVISPFNIHTSSSKKVMKILKLVS